MTASQARHGGMTEHPKDAVEVMARALAESGHMTMAQARVVAPGWLDQIAPHYREQAARPRSIDRDWADFMWTALNEAKCAMTKFPQPNYVISKVAEEAGEVVKAAIHCAEGRETAENVRDEMRQLIAMLYRLWVEGDQVHGLPPIAAAIRKGE